MTYTIIGRCPRTQRFGLGIATFSFAVGQICDGLKAGVGVTISQANVRRGNNRLALNLMEAGFRPETVVEALCKDDPEPDYRQIAVLDCRGEVAAFSGQKARPWCGHVFGPGVIAFGNGLEGPQVVEAMLTAYAESEAEDLEERFLRALEAGQAAGGQGQGRFVPELSCALTVYGENSFPDTNLRVDMHDTAIAEMRRIYKVYSQYHGWYRSRDKTPSQALSLEAFRATLV